MAGAAIHAAGLFIKFQNLDHITSGIKQDNINLACLFGGPGFTGLEVGFTHFQKHRINQRAGFINGQWHGAFAAFAMEHAAFAMLAVFAIFTAFAAHMVAITVTAAKHRPLAAMVTFAR